MGGRMAGRRGRVWLVTLGLAGLLLPMALSDGKRSAAQPSSDEVVNVDAPLVEPLDEYLASEMAEYYGLSIEEGRRRVVGQLAAIEFKELLPASIKDHWAGGVVDHEHGGQRRWFVTTDAARAELESRSADLSPVVGPLPVEVGVVEHSLAELENGVQQLAGMLDATGAVVTYIGGEIEHNRLTVGVPANAEAFIVQSNARARSVAPAAGWELNVTLVETTLEQFEAETGIGVVSELSQEARIDDAVACTAREWTGTNHRTLHCDAPMRGGPFMFRNTDSATFVEESWCSLGFQVRRNSDDALFALTAGHCARSGREDGDADRGRKWFTHQHNLGTFGNHWIGTWWEGAFTPARGDGGIIAIWDTAGWNAGWPIVFAGPQGSAFPLEESESYVINARGSWGDLDASDWVCKTGGVDWTDCGRYVGPPEVQVHYQGTQQWVRLVEDLRACKGDSGGPVYVGHRAYGIAVAGYESVGEREWISGGSDFFGPISGMSNCNKNADVMDLYRPLNALNVRLVTSSNP